MKPVWTRAAIRDLTHVRDYIARENPSAAREVASHIVDSAERVLQYPEVGRIGRVNGTREMIIPGTQYLIVYRLKKNAVHFLRVRHGRREWPKAK